MAHLAHAFDRRTVRCTLQAGDLDLQAEKLDALRTVFDPLATALEIVLDAANQFIGDADQFARINFIDKVAEPVFGLLGLALALNDRLAIEADRDRSILMLDADDVATVIGVE